MKKLRQLEIELDDLNDPPVCEHGSPLSESKCYDGFTGAPIYVTTFKDGCQEVDDSLDNINWVK